MAPERDPLKVGRPVVPGKEGGGDDIVTRVDDHVHGILIPWLNRWKPCFHFGVQGDLPRRHRTGSPERPTPPDHQARQADRRDHPPLFPRHRGTRGLAPCADRPGSPATWRTPLFPPVGGRRPAG